MADSSRTGLSQALEQAFITFADAIAQNNSAAQTGSSVQQSTSNPQSISAVASDASFSGSPELTSSTRYLSKLLDVFFICWAEQ